MKLFSRGLLLKKTSTPELYVPGLSLWLDGYDAPVNNKWVDRINGITTKIYACGYNENGKFYNQTEGGYLETETAVQLDYTKGFTIEYTFKPTNISYYVGPDKQLFSVNSTTGEDILLYIIQGRNSFNAYGQEVGILNNNVITGSQWGQTYKNKAVTISIKYDGNTNFSYKINNTNNYNGAVSKRTHIALIKVKTGRNLFSISNLAGEMYNIRYYNRPLTDEEQTLNYNRDRERFNF